MALHTKIQVSIAGQVLPVINNFSLHENIGNHASFTISVESKSLGQQSEASALLDNSKQFLGEACIVEIGDVNSSNQSLQFKGIVTNIQSTVTTSNDNFQEIIMISGMSSSICLDGGAHMGSALEQSLSEIIENALGDFDGSKLKVVVSPENDSTLLYSVQHIQSPFKYLQYLAKTQGEFLLYAKDTLYFGKPDLGAPIILNLGSTLENLSLGLNPNALNYNYFSNDYFSEANVESPSSAVATSAEGYTSFTNDISEQLFPNETQINFSSFEDSQLQQRLDTLLEKQKQALEQNQVTIHGKSYHTGVSLGKIITIESNGNNHGTYRVIKISHQCGDSGRYSNNFTAVPTDIDVSPNININLINRTDTQIAKVYANVDPEGMSRVQVQFPWQVAVNTTTPWLRMLTPHSGPDKGFHFIPEVGDEVIIGFEGGNAERPYVMGALYTGVNKPEEFQSDANNVKAIRTRSGHTIELNDTEGEEKINIYDNEGSIITFDTVEKSLTINATETIDIAAKNINITAEENITIGAQGAISVASDGDTAIQAQGAMDIQATGDATLTSSGAVAVEATSDATLKGANAVVSGQATAEMNGAQTKVAGSAMTEVSGGIVKIN